MSEIKGLNKSQHEFRSVCAILFQKQCYICKEHGNFNMKHIFRNNFFFFSFEKIFTAEVQTLQIYCVNIYGRIRACNCTDSESVLDKHMRLAHFFLQDITEIFYLIFYSKQCTRLVYSRISQIKTCKLLKNSQYIIILCYLWQLRSKDFIQKRLSTHILVFLIEYVIRLHCLLLLFILWQYYVLLPYLNKGPTIPKV